MIPMAALRVDRERPDERRFTFLHVALEDPVKDDALVLEASKPAAARVPDAFAVVVDSTQSVNDLRACKASEGRATIRLQFTFGQESVTSEPVPAKVRLDDEPGTQLVKTFGDLVFAKPIRHYLPCHSHHQNSPGVGNWTLCHGWCFIGDCECYSTHSKRWRKECYGWTVCLC